MNLRAFVLIGLALLGGGAVILGSQQPDLPPAATAARGSAPAAPAAARSTVLQAAPASDVVQVYKSPTCGCCVEWIEHLKEHGFTVEVIDQPDMFAVKNELGLPRELASCHTARVAGYLVEGHVPAQDIRRLLEDRPQLAGLAVPGMPVGSPGMEVEGQPADEYDVVAFDASGTTSIWASY
jgi:hypothetical protein